MKTAVLPVFLLAGFSALLRAADYPSTGARSAAMGNISVSLSDVWSTANNPAGTGFLRQISAGLNTSRPFLMKELSTHAAAFVLPVSGGTAGLYASGFGYAAYSENKLGLSFGKPFGEKLAAGVSINYQETAIAEYGKKNSFIASAGILVRPAEQLAFGVSVYNLTRTKVACYNDERIPSVIRIGLHYLFSEKVLVAIESEKDIAKPLALKAGMEYAVHPVLRLRAGMQTHPSTCNFGFGLCLKKIKLDLSSSYHSTLGFSPQAGLIYEFDRRDT